MEKFWKSLFNYSSFINWLISKLVRYGMDTVIIPVIQVTILNTQYQISLAQKKKILDAVEAAKKLADKTNYDKAVDDMFK